MANVVELWRGGVEPAESGASGNEVQAYRGAVEPLSLANLLANDVESASEVSTPVIAGTHILLADDVESASEVTSPSAAGTLDLTATSVESTSEVSTPTVSVLLIRRLFRLTGEYIDG